MAIGLRATSGFVLVSTLGLILMLSCLTIASLSLFREAHHSSAAYLRYHKMRTEILESYLRANEDRQAILNVAGMKIKDLAMVPDSLLYRSAGWRYQQVTFDDIPEIRVIRRERYSEPGEHHAPAIYILGSSLFCQSVMIEGVTQVWQLPYGSYFVHRPQIVKTARGWIALAQWMQPIAGGWRLWLEWRGVDIAFQGRVVLAHEAAPAAFYMQLLAWESPEEVDGLLIWNKKNTYLFNLETNEFVLKKLPLPDNEQPPKLFRRYDGYHSYIVQVSSDEPKIALTPVSREGVRGSTFFIYAGEIQSAVEIVDDTFVWVVPSAEGPAIKQSDMQGQVKVHSADRHLSAPQAFDNSFYRQTYSGLNPRYVASYSHSSITSELVFSDPISTLSIALTKLTPYGLHIQERDVNEY